MMIQGIVLAKRKVVSKTVFMNQQHLLETNHYVKFATLPYIQVIEKCYERIEVGKEEMISEKEIQL